MQEAIHIEVWSDYACPWCFLNAHNLQKLVKSHPVEIRWRAFELRPKDGPPPPAEHLAKIQAKRPQVYAMMRQKYGLMINPGPFGIDSRPALIGAKVAEDAGCGAAYHAGTLRAYWQEAQNIEDAAVLSNIAQEAGLKRDLFLDYLGQPRFRQAVLDDIALAKKRELRTVPSLIFAGKYLVTGAQPQTELAQIVGRMRSEKMERA